MYSGARDPTSLGYTPDISNLNDASSDTHATAASVDLISSARQLEQHFKEKYKSLRNAYTQRVRQLADVVTDTCAGLFTDEMIEEMKGDKLSTTFIPSHINEIIERHLDSERELFIHQTVDRCSTLEVDLSKATNMIRSQQQLISMNGDEITKLKRFEVANFELVADIKTRDSKIQDFETEVKNLRNKIFELEDFSMNSKEIIDHVKEDLKHQERENSQLREAMEEARVKILQYEETIENKAHDLDELAQAEYNERSLREDLREELTERSRQNNTQQAEIGDLRIDIRFLKEALERKDADLQAKLLEERRTRDKVDALMEQVESMLTQEAKISNATIEAMHEKMKILRHRLAQDITREKRVSAALQDELQLLRATKDEKVRELKVFVEEEGRLRALLLTEQQASAALNKEVQTQVKAMTEYRLLLLTAENDAKLLSEKLLDMERRSGDEIRVAEERAHLEAGRDFAEERRKLEEAHSVYRLQVQNQLDLTVSRSFLGQTSSGAEALRRSYPSGSGSESPQRQHAAKGVHYSAGDMRHSYTFGQSTGYQTNPSPSLFATTQGPQFFNTLYTDGVGGNGYMKVVNDLKDQLADSYDNIDELQTIVRECRRTIDEQQRTIEDERAKLLAAQQQHQHMHKITERIATATAPIVSSTSIETIRMLEQSQSRVHELERQLVQLSTSTAVVLANSNSSAYSQATEEMEKLAELKRQQIMYLEDINKKNNVINTLNDQLGEFASARGRLEAQVRELQDALSECQDQAMKDQANDMLLIADMQRKFESLMTSYESNSSSNDAKNAERIAYLESLLCERDNELAARVSPSSSDAAEAKATLALTDVSTERISALESLLLDREGQLASANRSVAESSNLLHKLTEDLLSDAELLQHAREESSDLRTQMRMLKDIILTAIEVDSSAFYQWDLAAIGRALEQRITLLLSSSLSTSAPSSSNNSSSSSSADSNTSITTAPQALSAATQTTATSTSSAGTSTAHDSAALSTSASAATGVVAAATSARPSPIKADLAGSPGPIKAASKAASPAGNIYADLHDSTEKIYSLEVELANSALLVRNLSDAQARGEMCVISYDSVLKGLLGALTASSLVSREGCEALYRKYVPAHARQVATFEDTAISAGVRADVEECLHKGGLNEELAQVKNEHMLLMELANLESEATIKALNERTEDLKRDHEVELAALRSELASIDSALRKALDAELAGCRADELSRTASMASRLKAEQSRRQHLQASLEEMERNYNQMAAQLSDALLRAEAAENEILKSRFRI